MEEKEKKKIVDTLRFLLASSLETFFFSTQFVTTNWNDKPENDANNGLNENK